MQLFGPIAAAIPDHAEWYVAGLIVVIGLFVIGIQDLVRFSWRRAWAISSVSFAESLRRRVLWITPLAILGVILVSQLQKPLDEQDAIRQTTKFCLFATGLLVVVVAIILACTNLPKEIESRVIFTIVTKPTTRLELVLGKVIGFARVSAAILLIMGLFTFTYLHLRAWSLRNAVAERLATPGGVEETLRPTLEHYKQAGLLSAKQYVFPADLNVYARVPEPGAHERWIVGNGEQDILVPFEVTPEELTPIVPGMEGAPPGSAGLVVLMNIRWKQRPLTTQETEALPEAPAEVPASPMGPTLPQTQPATSPVAKKVRPKPSVTVDFLNSEFFSMIGANHFNSGRPIVLPESGEGIVQVVLPADALSQLDFSKPLRFYLQIIGQGPGVEYGVDDLPAQIGVTGHPGNIQLAGKPIFRGREANYAQQLRGSMDPGDSVPVAVFHFEHVRPENAAGEVPFELRAQIERSGADVDAGSDDPTHVVMRFRDNATGKISEPIELKPESKRTAYFTVPAAALGGGSFDVLVQCRTNGHWLNLRPQSLTIALASQSFAFNLFKSLLIMWLMAILVVIISVFCSTFLSWPIAVVLTLVILLGHWGVDQLGDATGPGLSRMFITDVGIKDPALAKTLSTSIDALTKGLRILTPVLPDISQFSATEEIERGVAIPNVRLADALQVLGLFGVSLLVLSYVFMKYKEVAP